ncbi:MAG TPA: hypothetical protein VK961_24425 [Chthoniobacter sp.]|nr:hypothetical protein [Chthoniobacter sp.]
MNTSRSLSAGLLALVTLPILAFSQDVKKDTPAADAANPRVIEAVKFKNATYGEIIDSLRVESGENIMVAPELQNEKAPEVEMRHVTVWGVLDAICKVTGLYFEASKDLASQDNGTVTWLLMQPPDPVLRTLEPNPPKPKICRVFKASAKEKLTSPQLEHLLANISDAARKVCEVNARAQGHPAAEAPVIEAHAGTGIVIVAGTESDVQLVGQVIQALGGEVVPLTGTVSSSGPFVRKDAEGGLVEFEGFIPSSRPITSVPDAVKDTRKQLEAARDQVKKLEKKLEQLGQQTPAKVLTPPTPPTPPKVKF